MVPFSDEQNQRLVEWRLDWTSVAAIMATLLDVVTTVTFIVKRAGYEANEVLAPLIEHSILWIPLYLLSKPSLILLMPNVSRQTVATFFITIGLLAGTNNLSGLLFGNYFIVGAIGIGGISVIGIVLAGVVFVVQLDKNWHDRARVLRSLVIWFVGLGLIEVSFIVCSKYLV